MSKRYVVTIEEIVTYRMEVEADDPNGAEDLAQVLFAEADDVNHWLVDVCEREHTPREAA